MVEVLDFEAQGGSEAVEGLTKGHGDGILQLGATHFDDVLVLFGLLIERGDDGFDVGNELEVLEIHAHVDGVGVGVVGRL